MVLEAAHRLKVPVRALTPGVHDCGDFYGQSAVGESWPEGITVGALVRIIERLPPGLTELSCHPGLGEDFDSVYRTERTREVEVLCHPLVRRALDEHDVRLVAFSEPG